ncbi:hypothetical protein [Ruegeria meonggei]|uniref:hypothetical protein n=1 Tax=Ruegeria meonggei TaxID=1446476 RepID=UPI00366C4F70
MLLHSYYMRAILPLLTCLLSLPSTAISVTPELEASGKQLPQVTGTVIGVRSNGVMLLHPSGEGNQTIISVRQWGYEVDPKLLSFSVLGREVGCTVLYDGDGILGGNCSLQFFPNFETSRKWRGDESLDSISQYYGFFLTHYLKILGIGRFMCSDQDRRFLSELPQEPPFRRGYLLERCDYFDQIESEEGSD